VAKVPLIREKRELAKPMDLSVYRNEHDPSGHFLDAHLEFIEVHTRLLEDAERRAAIPVDGLSARGQRAVHEGPDQTVVDTEMRQSAPS
jgi:hypothetical protein